MIYKQNPICEFKEFKESTPSALAHHKTAAFDVVSETPELGHSGKRLVAARFFSARYVSSIRRACLTTEVSYLAGPM